MEVNVPHFCTNNTSSGSEVTGERMGRGSDLCGIEAGAALQKEEIGLLIFATVQIMTRFRTYK